MKSIYKNYTVFLVAIGMIVGIIVYLILNNFIGIEPVIKYKIYNQRNLFIFLFVTNMKLWIFSLILSVFKWKEKAKIFLILYLSFFMGENLVIFFTTLNMYCFTSIIGYIAKIISIVFLFTKEKIVINKIISLGIIIIISLIEKILLINF